jgi:hypothetical protein
MTPAELRRCAFDFRAARALFAGVELGVFGALGRGAASSEALATRCGADARGLRILLDALTALGILERSGARYWVHRELIPLLAPGEPDGVSDLLLHDVWQWSSWARLAQVIQGGAPLRSQDGDPHLGNPDVLRRLPATYVAAMEQSQGESPARLAQRLAPLANRSVLDVGGGSGAHLCALLERVPSARGVLVDRPFVLEQARQRIDQRGLSRRVQLEPLDYERDPLPGTHDLVLLSRVLMGLPAERALALVERAAAAVAPGGSLAVHEYDPASRVGALLSLDVLQSSGGEVHAPEAIRGWIEEAGLVPEPAEDVLPYTRLLLGSRRT